MRAWHHEAQEDGFAWLGQSRVPCDGRVLPCQAFGRMQVPLVLQSLARDSALQVMSAEIEYFDLGSFPSQ